MTSTLACIQRRWAITPAGLATAFWPTLFAARFSETLLSPSAQRALLGHGHGNTNLVARTTATADELTGDELIAGARHL
jgi:TDG/mug DNA glycosylase family protein